MKKRVGLPAISLLLASAPAWAQASRFDGAWAVDMVCPAHRSNDDDAKGYHHAFPAQVVNGELRGQHRTDGEPGYHLLMGKIRADGSATLRLDGIVNNPNYAINNAPMGKKYSYAVKAMFDDKKGEGRRLSGRTCEFTFTRQ